MANFQYEGLSEVSSLRLLGAPLQIPVIFPSDGHGKFDLLLSEHSLLSESPTLFFSHDSYLLKNSTFALT